MSGFHEFNCEFVSKSVSVITMQTYEIGKQGHSFELAVFYYIIYKKSKLFCNKKTPENFQMLVEMLMRFL